MFSSVRGAQHAHACDVQTWRRVALQRWTKKWLRKQSLPTQISLSTMSSALETLIQQGITSQRKQLQLHVTERDGRIICQKCAEQRVVHAGWTDFNQDNISNHFKVKHKDITIYTPEQFQNARKRRRRDQPAIDQKFLKIESIKGVQCAVNMLRKHPGMPLSYFDSPVFLQPWEDSKGVSRKSVSQAVKEDDKQRFEIIKQNLRNKLVGGQADGGKGVTGDKLIGKGLNLDGRFYCWHLSHPPAGTYYDADFYKEEFEEFVDEVDGCGALMCGMTMDNEASLNAGFMKMLEYPDYEYLVHSRCTNHTSELLLSDVQEAIPVLATCTTACHDIVTVIRNTKAFKDALANSQLSQGSQPKRLIKPANTRKWSTSFLMLSRFQQLYTQLSHKDDHFAPAEAPQLRVWRETWLTRLRDQVPADVLRACVRMLYWIYVGEQVLQRDSSSIIHAAFVFENMCSIMRNRNVPEIQRISPLLLAGANQQAIQGSVNRRREVVASSKVYHLSIAMWPVTDNQVLDEQAANDELDSYISKCWRKWQHKQNVFGSQMPLEFRVQNLHDEEEMREKQEAFKNAAGMQLTMHLVGGTQRIVNAKAAFTRTATAVFDSLTTGLEMPKVLKGTIVSDRFKLKDYWLSIHSDVPALYLVFLTLHSICATEAGCERIFSKDGFIHNDLRNRLSHDLVVALMRNAMNAENFDGILNDQFIWDDIWDVNDDGGVGDLARAFADMARQDAEDDDGQ